MYLLICLAASGHTAVFLPTANRELMNLMAVGILAVLFPLMARPFLPPALIARQFKRKKKNAASLPYNIQKKIGIKKIIFLNFRERKIFFFKFI